MDKCIDLIGDTRIFSTLDADSRNCRGEIAQDDQGMTVFTSHHGLLCFTLMPFGLKSGPDMFERAMEVLPTKVKW